MLALATAQLWVLAVAGAALGAAIGSFGCVIIERLPVALDEPDETGSLYTTRPWGEVFGGNSRCSSCGAAIRWFHKIPILSWFLLRGTCSDCGDRIPGFHPVVEFLVPALSVGLVAAHGWDARLLPALWLVPVAVIVSFIDLRTLIVPTRIVWPAFFVAVALSVLASAIEGEWSWLWGGALGLMMLAGPLAVLWLVLPGSMGFGDVRLGTLIGWVVGFVAYHQRWTTVGFLIVCLFVVASVTGIVMGVGALMTQGRKAKVPFGPALCIAAFVMCAFGDDILRGFEMI